MSAERTLSELTMDLAAQAGDLIRNEIRLARAEAMDSVKRVSAGIVRIAIGVAFAGGAVSLGLIAIAYALGEAMPMWVGALVSALIGGAIAYLLIKSGLKTASLSAIALPKTAEQVSRDLKLIKESAQS